MFINKLRDVLKANYPFLNPVYGHYIQCRHNAKGVVFVTHRVSEIDKRRLIPNENMKVSPSFLERIIILYKKVGIEFFSMDDLYRYIKGSIKIDKPFVCFTFDDGYRDNYLNAYPIFKKYGVPFTVYVATDFPDYKALLWWYELEDLLLNTDEYHLGSGEIVPCHTYEEKCAAFLFIRDKILKLRKSQFLEDYCQLLNLKESNIDKYVKELSMSWNEISLMSKDPICTIGGHSITHPVFNLLTEEELSHEVLGGCKKIEDIIGMKVNHFAYPFGSPNEIGEREHRMMSDYGFCTISTTDFGYINGNTLIESIPRCVLHDKNI